MDDADLMGENADCLVDNKQQSIISFFKPVSSKPKSSTCVVNEGCNPLSKNLSCKQEDSVKKNSGDKHTKKKKKGKEESLSGGVVLEANVGCNEQTADDSKKKRFFENQMENSKKVNKAVSKKFKDKKKFMEESCYDASVLETSTERNSKEETDNSEKVTEKKNDSKGKMKVQSGKNTSTNETESTLDDKEKDQNDKHYPSNIYLNSSDENNVDSKRDESEDIGDMNKQRMKKRNMKSFEEEAGISEQKQSDHERIDAVSEDVSGKQRKEKEEEKDENYSKSDFADDLKWERNGEGKVKRHSNEGKIVDEDCKIVDMDRLSESCSETNTACDFECHGKTERKNSIKSYTSDGLDSKDVKGNSEKGSRKVVKDQKICWDQVMKPKMATKMDNSTREKDKVDCNEEIILKKVGNEEESQRERDGKSLDRFEEESKTDNQEELFVWKGNIGQEGEEELDKDSCKVESLSNNLHPLFKKCTKNKRGQYKAREDTDGDGDYVDKDPINRVVKKDEICDSEEPSILLRRSRRQKGHVVKYSDFISQDSEEDCDFQPQKRKTKKSKSLDNEAELQPKKDDCDKGKQKGKKVEVKAKRAESSMAVGNSLEEGNSGPAPSSPRWVDASASGESEKEKMNDEQLVVTGSAKLSTSAASVSKSTFLAQFTKQKLVRCEDLVIIEKDSALPTVSHVRQISDSEMDWYRAVGTTNKCKRNVTVAERGAELPIISGHATWAALLNRIKPERREVPTTQRIPLTAAVNESLVSVCDFPLLKVLMVYVNCQRNVIRHCLAKAEIPKSNLKIIWDRQEKCAKSEQLTIRSIDEEQASPAIDIRSMSGKAKSRKLKVDAGGKTSTVEEYIVLKAGADKVSAGGSKMKKAIDKKSRKKKATKFEEKLMEDSDLDSSVEILTKEEAPLKKTNTIAESFTKINERVKSMKYEKGKSDSSEEFVSRNEDAKSDHPRRRKSGRRNNVFVDEEARIGEENEDNYCRRKLRSVRRRNQMKEKLSGCEKGEFEVTGSMKSYGESGRGLVEDEEIDVETVDDIDEDFVDEKKKKYRKKRRELKEKNSTSIDLISKENIDNDVCTGSASTGAKKSRKERRKKKKGKVDEDQSLRLDENIPDECTCSQRDIRLLFVSANPKEDSKSKRVSQAESRELRGSKTVEDDSKNAEVLIDNAGKIIGKDDVTFSEESKPASLDIRNLFRKSLEKAGSGSTGISEEEGLISVQSEASRAQLLQSDMKAEGVSASTSLKGFVEDVTCSEFEKEEQREDALHHPLIMGGTAEDDAVIKGEKISMEVMDTKPHFDNQSVGLADRFNKAAGEQNLLKDANEAREKGGCDIIRRKVPSKRKKRNSSSEMKTIAVKDEESSEDIIEGEKRIEEGSNRCKGTDENFLDGKAEPVENSSQLLVGGTQSKSIMGYFKAFKKADKSEMQESEQTISESSKSKECNIAFGESRPKRKRGSTSRNKSSTGMSEIGCANVSSEDGNSKISSTDAKRAKISTSVENTDQVYGRVNLDFKSEKYVGDEVFACKDESAADASEGGEVCCRIDGNADEKSVVVKRKLSAQPSDDVSDVLNSSDEEVLAFHEKVVECGGNSNSNTSSLPDGCVAPKGSAKEPLSNAEARPRSFADLVGVTETGDKTETKPCAKPFEVRCGCEIKRSSDSADRPTDLLPESDQNKMADSLSDILVDVEGHEKAISITHQGDLKSGASGDVESVSVVDLQPKQVESGKRFDQVPKERPTRKRKTASIAVNENNEGEEAGRRRSSRVKQKEELKKEDAKMRQCELERISLEISEQSENSQSPIMKRRRKSRRISENRDEIDRNEETDFAALDSENKGSDLPEGGVIGNESYLSVIDKPLGITQMGDLKAKTQATKDSKDTGDAKWVELPQIDEDYINSSLLWTEKYAPVKHDQVIGNNLQTKKVFDWLSIWKEKHEQFVIEIMASKKSWCRSKLDDDSDFDDSSDNEDDQSVLNTFVIIGKVGCGSTSIVYACAQELGYKVLEMHPSNYRSGKQIQALLGEATQSHQVKRKFHGNGTGSNSITNDSTQGTRKIASFFGGHASGDTDSKQEISHSNIDVANNDDHDSLKCESSANVAGEMSLILFEQADIVFEEQDKGFWFGLNELRKQAKRPIIITANDPSVVSKLDGACHDIIDVSSVRKDLLVRHLLAMSLAESFKPPVYLIEEIVKNCKNDIRKSILKLQFTFEQWKRPNYQAMKYVVQRLSVADVERNADVVNLDDRQSPAFGTQCSDSKSRDSHLIGSDHEACSTFSHKDLKSSVEDTDRKATDSKLLLGMESCLPKRGPTSSHHHIQDLSSRKCGFQYSDYENIKSFDDETKHKSDKGLTSETSAADDYDIISSAVASGLHESNGDPKSEETAPQERADSSSEAAKMELEKGELDEDRETLVRVIKEDHVKCSDSDEKSLFDTAKVKSEKLFHYHANCREKSVDASQNCSDVSRVLNMVSASADALSFMDTFCESSDPASAANTCNYGWWHSNPTDGILDVERHTPAANGGFLLHNARQETIIAYTSMHERIVEEHDKDFSRAVTIKSEAIAETYMSLERHLSLSGCTDHRSLCMDVIPALSTICKSEEGRKVSQFGRRSRRFLHYLDAIGLHLQIELKDKIIHDSMIEQSWKDL